MSQGPDPLAQDWLTYANIKRGDKQSPHAVLTSRSSALQITAPIQGPPIGLLSESKFGDALFDVSRNGAELVKMARAIAYDTANFHFSDKDGQLLTYVNYLTAQSNTDPSFKEMAGNLRKAYLSGYMPVVRRGDNETNKVRSSAQALKEARNDSDDGKGDLILEQDIHQNHRAARRLEQERQSLSTSGSESDRSTRAGNYLSNSERSTHAKPKAAFDPVVSRQLVSAPLLGGPIMSNAGGRKIGDLWRRLQELGRKTALLHRSHKDGPILSLINSRVEGRTLQEAGNVRWAVRDVNTGNSLLEAYCKAYQECHVELMTEFNIRDDNRRKWEVTTRRALLRSAA